MKLFAFDTLLISIKFFCKLIFWIHEIKLKDSIRVVLKTSLKLKSQQQLRKFASAHARNSNPITFVTILRDFIAIVLWEL